MTAAMNTLILATLAVATTAMPSYIALPADQIAFLDLRDLGIRRVPRQILTPPPPPQVQYHQDLQPILQPYQRQPIAAKIPAPPARIQIQPGQDIAGASNSGSVQFAERAPDFGEYVDFGAHTGDHGAFGWYADYPINNNNHDSGY